MATDYSKLADAVFASVETFIDKRDAGLKRELRAEVEKQLEPVLRQVARGSEHLARMQSKIAQQAAEIAELRVMVQRL